MLTPNPRGFLASDHGFIRGEKKFTIPTDESVGGVEKILRILKVNTSKPKLASDHGFIRGEKKFTIPTDESVGGVEKILRILKVEKTLKR